MEKVRRPVVAGAFYPEDPDKLAEKIAQYLSLTSVDTKGISDILGVISPHAGYDFSGGCAAYSFKSIQEKEFTLAVVIAPSHQYGDFYFSVGDYEQYETPLGRLNTDKKLIDKLLADPKFVFYPYAHTKEHSLEVQLPFLQTIKPDAKILPILIGYQYDLSSKYLAQKLISILEGRIDETVFIISSDLSHYHSSEVAEKMDSDLYRSIEKLDIDLFTDLINARKSEACGFGPILAMMWLARELDYPKVKTLKYTHSGHSGGDYSHVVGYLSSMFYR